MWIVRLALRRPYTFVVAAMLVSILGAIIIIGRMATDIFPNVDIPVIAVAFNYTGMSPQDMDQRIVTPFERFLTTTVNDIEHIESQSLYGVGIIKIYFQPNAKIENANAQVTAVSQTATRIMPPGTQPPLILEYNASSVPIIQLAVDSNTLPEAQIFDQALYFLRPPLTSIPGLQTPYPYGGKQRNIVVDLDSAKLAAFGLSSNDVSVAINNQNLILPAGTIKMGKQEAQVKLNASPRDLDDLNNLPIKSINGTTVYVRDVAQVRDGFIVQTNVVRANGKPAVLMSILKNGSASTLDVVNGVQKALPGAEATLPPGMNVTPMFDQSVFVRASVGGVVKEALIAAGLTALMILLFLGSWRSTLIVIISIPLSIVVSIIILYFLGETLNVMTLGGMALAVGILVDDATVEIENIHRNLHQRKRLVKAILDGASQIAVPAFVSTLCICIVFVPVVFISGAAKYLFTPLAMSVVFAMLTSYLLSRTLVPTMVHYLLAAEVEMYGGVIDKSDPHAMHMIHHREALEHHQPLAPEDETFGDKMSRLMQSYEFWGILLLSAALIGLAIYLVMDTSAGNHAPAIRDALRAAKGWLFGNRRTVALWVAIAIMAASGAWLVGHFNLIWNVHHAFNRQFEKLRRFYGGLLDWSLDHRGSVVTAFVVMVAISCCLITLIGTDFFPTVDAGQIRLHVRAPAGTRIEQTMHYFTAVEKVIQGDKDTPGIIPPEQITSVLDNIGIPNSSINLSLSDGSLMSPADGEILISLGEGHSPTADYMRKMRAELPGKFPDLQFFFAPADIITQVLNFGLQAPIDVQIAGVQGEAGNNEKLAQKIKREVAAKPGIVDVRLQQVSHTPDVRVTVDRILANQVGLDEKDVASDLLVSLSSSNQTAPSYWLDQQLNINRNIFVMTPQYKMDTMGDLENTPISPTNVPATPQNTQLLSNLARVSRADSPTNVVHYDTKPAFDVLMNVQGTDLGSAAKYVQAIVDNHKNDLHRGSTIKIRGQVQSMHDSFFGLGFGLIFAVVLVYLLMVINFQSWIDPLIILMALPGALAGILWMLWATHTNISVPALMGSIMSIGVATANSILMITFANDQREIGMDSRQAALSAGLTRLRPVLMTALAMIIGMLPMSLGLGEGGEQNAPLGRAVIGGLLLATFSTLFFVPVVYSMLRRKPPELQVEEELR